MDIGRLGGLAALVGSCLGYGAVLALLASFGLSHRVVSHVVVLTFWIGSVSAVILVYAWLGSRRHGPGSELTLAKLGLHTLWLGPAVWVWVFAEIA